MTSLLFICTGNTCRSPMAEGFFNLEAQKRGLSARASSCGTGAFSFEPATPEAEAAAKEYGADLSGHRSRPVSETLMRRADRIYCMTKAQKNALAGYFPEYAEKIRTLSGRDIPDPYMRGEEAYRQAAGEIYEAVARLIGKEDGLK